MGIKLDFWAVEAWCIPITKTVYKVEKLSCKHRPSARSWLTKSQSKMLNDSWEIRSKNSEKLNCCLFPRRIWQTSSERSLKIQVTEINQIPKRFREKSSSLLFKHISSFLHHACNFISIPFLRKLSIVHSLLGN